MVIEHLPETVQALYAELLDESIAAAASAATSGMTSGSFVSKKVKGHTYWYIQRSEGERVRQIYLGPESGALTAWMVRVRDSRRDETRDVELRASLCAMLRSGGAATEPAFVIKVLELLSESLFFRLGGVLVGTNAFRVFGNMLGVRLHGKAAATQDIDVAHDRGIGIGLAREQNGGDLEQALMDGDLGFLPVPSLDPAGPSTSFKVRGRQLRVDFLTPMRGRETAEPVFLSAFNVSAVPVRWLDYLIESAQQAVVIGTRPVLVNVPDPARFALHKLLIANRRPAAFQTKAAKDIDQAGRLIEILSEDRPEDLRQAWEALHSRSEKAAELSMRTAVKLRPSLLERLRAITET